MESVEAHIAARAARMSAEPGARRATPRISRIAAASCPSCTAASAALDAANTAPAPHRPWSLAAAGKCAWQISARLARVSFGCLDHVPEQHQGDIAAMPACSMKSSPDWVRA